MVFLAQDSCRTVMKGRNASTGRKSPPPFQSWEMKALNIPKIGRKLELSKQEREKTVVACQSDRLYILRLF
jgi:hypothetical protein